MGLRVITIGTGITLFRSILVRHLIELANWKLSARTGITSHDHTDMAQNITEFALCHLSYRYSIIIMNDEPHKTT